MLWLIRHLAARYCETCGAWLLLEPSLLGSWWHEDDCPEARWGFPPGSDDE